MIYLKGYQKTVVQEFEAFFRAAAETKQGFERDLLAVPEEIRERFANVNWVGDTFKQIGKLYNDKCLNGLGKYYPRLVLKVPTGGGKTLLAVEAIRAYQNLFAQKRTGLVVWIVPSETIYSQTVQKLRDKSNVLRQLLDQSSGNRTIILEKGQTLTADDIENNLVVLFVMIQSIRRSNSKESLKVFQDSGGFESFFPTDSRYDLHGELLKQFPNLDHISALGTQQPEIRTSLGNAVRVSRPFIIIDEIHKVFSDLARQTIDNLNPEMVLGLSATPKREMNILVNISGLDLKAEEMIKLDMHIYPPEGGEENDWKSMLRDMIAHRAALESRAQELEQATGLYIRPIALIQVEATGKDQRGRGRVHSLDAKEFLIEQKINPDEIAIKTSSQNDIEDVNLFARDCPVRYIITKEALREGWDCSFAYLLGVIPNVNSNTGITQLIGRILRQPNAKKTGIKELDESYVYYSRGRTGEMVKRVQTGFKNEGLEELFNNVKFNENEDFHKSKTARIRKEFSDGYGNAFFLPVWLVMDEKGQKRRFSYAMDIKARLNFYDFSLAKENVEKIKESLSPEAKRRREFVFTLHEVTGFTSHEAVEAIQEDADGFINIDYLTRRYEEVMGNAFLARKQALAHIGLLQKQIAAEDLEENFGFVASMLHRYLVEEARKQEEQIFLSMLNDGKLVLAVSDDPELGFRVPETDEIVVGQESNLYRYYLFDDVELITMNSLERTVGDILDKQEKILWWFRNKVSHQWYSIQGWQQYKIRPDFVAARKGDDEKLELVYILEAKGEHLSGNPDTIYKKKVLDKMTEVSKKKNIVVDQTKFEQLNMFGDKKINEAVEFYFVEQGSEEEDVRRLFK
jgi:type III restriction enzyme